VTDPYEARRPYYQEQLAKGVERFFEPRRATCPWCGSANLSVRLQTSDLIQHKPGRFVLEQCGACRHIFQNPRLTPAGLSFYYRDFYDGLGQELMDRITNANGCSYRGRIAMLQQFTTPTSWLDVGTSYGHFCQLARTVWPDCVFDGLDQSISVLEAQHRGSLDRGYQGEFVALADELAGRYDVISMHHYLEHTREPFDELDAAAKVLTTGSHLLIELPDPESPFGRLLGQWWMPWFQPQHQHMIPVDNLVHALGDRGFSVVAIERGAAHQSCDLFYGLMLALNAASPDHRLPWLATKPARRRPLLGAAIWAMGTPLLMITLLLDKLLEPVVRRTRTGNAYRVLACKDG
jgi:SAM-dependent methyltransferase